MATLDQDTATECVYSVPRGGKAITGPSIRFAEMVLVAWGNIDVSTTIIRDDHVAAIVQGRAHDLETNVSLAMEARRPVHKKRSKSAPDEDDKQLAVSVASSLARRNVILAIVPKALWAGAYFAAIDASTGDGTMEFKRIQAIEAFAKLGASESQVLVALGRKGPEEINIEDLRHLRGMYTAIRDKNLRLDDALRPPEPERPRGRTETGNIPRSNHPLAPAASAAPAVSASPSPMEPARDFDPETGEASDSDLDSFLPDEDHNP
jgi:hypothetical protein